MGEKNTEFAPFQRTTDADIQHLRKTLLVKELMIEALNCLPEVVFFLDENRQIIFYNRALSRVLNKNDASEVIGKRPGEIFSCVHSKEKEYGCGTTRSCAECGAVNAILSSQKGESSVKECRMRVQKGASEEAQELRVWTKPIEVEGENFTFFTIKDISDEKRREALERTFFHDIMNETGVIYNYLSLVKDGIMELDGEIAKRMYLASVSIIDVIKGQRDLLEAEKGNLSINREKFSVKRFLEDMIAQFSGSKWAEGKDLILDKNCPDVEIYTDRTLLRRVLGNLIKNASEASEDGETVTVGCEKKQGSFLFSVHNPAVMPLSVQMQIFQKSFSTKGKGRGTGTYSIKLFVEKYLKGEVSFVSEEAKGTIFFIKL